MPNTDAVSECATATGGLKAAMRDIQSRLVAHLAAGRTTDFAEGVLETGAGVYTDPVRLEAERRELFLKQPLVAGLSSDIPQPGNMMLFDAAGPSILVVRGKDGRVRAFLNTCRHRAAPVVTDCRKRNRLTCPFHGWTYDLEGRLIAVPGEAAFDGVEWAGKGLEPVPVAEWHGLIFVEARRGREEIDVETFLGPLAPLVKELDLARTAPVRATRLDVAANWKFAQGTFFEGYHLATVHPKTIAASTVTNILVHDEFGRHQRVVYPPNYFMDWVGKAESEWDHVPYQGIHLLFPNTILYCGHIERFGSRNETDRKIFGLWRTFPGGAAGEAFTLLSTYRPEAQADDADARPYEEISDFIFRVIETEDYNICSMAQRNLAAVEGAKLVFGRNEIALQHIHRRIAEAIDMPLDHGDSG